MDRPQRLGIDIGGTFTDFTMVDVESGQLRTMKVPSRPGDPSGAVMDGIGRLLEAHRLNPTAITYFVHGTTIALNTLIQRVGAPTGLIITRGFGDVLEIGRLRLPNPNDFMCERVPALVPRHLVREIDERLLADGTVLTPLDPAELVRAADELVAAGVEAIGVCFLHAYRNDAHEREAVALLRERHPTLYVASSAATWPEQREYERTLVTVMNGYLGGQMQRYFGRLQGVTAEAGMRTTLYTTKSNGGLMTADSAYNAPVETLLSGPASGVVGALHVARLAGFPQAISLDIGGTSADIAIIDGAIPYSTEGHAGDYPVIMPTVEISSIGAGGGSVAWTDAAGVLKVGPRSAGAEPGPACYGRGGTEPTVTDAYVTLGIVDPARFLGGRMPLDGDAARAAMDRLGERIGTDRNEAAASVIAVTTANMYAQLLPLMARRGADPREYALVAYGGAGPTHAFFLARELGITNVIVPRYPGLLCAFGSLVADLKSDFIATLNVRTDQIAYEQVETRFAELEDRARAWLRDQLGSLGAHTLTRTADMRYRGQSFEINVTIADETGRAETLAEVLERFHRDYEVVYSQADRGAPVEIVNIRVTIAGETPKPSLEQVPPAGEGQAPPSIGQRRIFLDGEWATATVYERTALRAGHRFDGPAVVEQDDSTVMLPAGTAARVDEWANLIVEVEA